jgi:hypothetical protein
MKERGPLLCSGSFPPASRSLLSVHAIVVYGYSERFGGVQFINPYGGTLGSMNLQTFLENLHVNLDSVQALKVSLAEDICQGNPLICLKQRQEVMEEVTKLGQGELPTLPIDISNTVFTKVPEPAIKTKPR